MALPLVLVVVAAVLAAVRLIGMGDDRLTAGAVLLLALAVGVA